MSLRTRLFLLFGSLVALLVVAQWWLVRSLTEDLSAELGEVAVSVGRRVLYFVSHDDQKGLTAAPPSGQPGRAKMFTYRIEVKEGHGKEVATQEITTPVQIALDPPAGVPNVDRILHLVGPGLKHSIPIPRSGVNDTVATFTRRLFLGLPPSWRWACSSPGRSPTAFPSP